MAIISQMVARSHSLGIDNRLSCDTIVLGMTLNCIHIFIVTGSFLHWCVMRPASQRFFIHSWIYWRILIISYLATFLSTDNSLYMLMCRKAVNQSIAHVQLSISLKKLDFIVKFKCNISCQSNIFLITFLLQIVVNTSRMFYLNYSWHQWPK